MTYSYEVDLLVNATLLEDLGESEQTIVYLTHST